jgi:predicted negative regulator of RcsB-dependent stress response
MDVRRKTGSKRWLLLLSIVIIGAGALFGFEYLGSDQVPQRVEKSIAIPNM